MSRRIHAALACLVALLSASAATADPSLPAYQPREAVVAKDARYLTEDGAVRIVGTEVLEEMLQRVNARYAALHSGTRFALSLKGTSAAIPALTHGVSAVAPMGRQVTWVENVPYSKVVGAPPLEIRVAHGSVSDRKKANVLAIFVNKANPLERLTLEQAARIFADGHAKGDLTQWSQLGVKGDLAKLAIHTYGANDDGGFGQYVLGQHLGGLRFRRGHERFTDSTQIVKRVGDDAAGIGFAALAYATPEVRVLALAPGNGEAYSRGTAEDVAAGRYPFDRYVYLYARREPGKPLDPFVREYLRFVLSRDGQALIGSEEGGYIPLNAAEAAAELAKLD